MLTNMVSRIGLAVPSCVLVATAIVGCNPAKTAEASSGGQQAESATSALKDVDCTSVLPDVIALSEGDSVKLLDIYKVAVVTDRLAAFAAGDLKIPADKNMVEVLTCKGVATFSDQTEERITYGVQVDVKNEVYVRWNA